MKYKHKKTGDIVKKLSDCNYCRIVDTYTDIPAKYIEDSCDWEKVEEYPIGTKIVDTIEGEGNGYIYQKVKENEWECLTKSNYTIKESDIGKNKRFEILEKLFTTDDGIDIYKEDSYYTVYFKGLVPENTKIFKLNGPYKAIPNDEDVTYSKDCKFFAKKENAQKYINENKSKEYEILSFIHKFNHIPHTLRDNNQYVFEQNSSNSQNKYKSKELINNSDWKIHSIKRLSDGVIFTIGDKIILGKFNLAVTLKKIEFESAPADKNTGKLTFITDSSNLFKSWKLSELSPYKSIYFVDGWKIKECNERSKIQEEKYFNTKEEAEQFIILNKPCLSLQDIKNVVNIPVIEEKLKELVKFT